MDSNTERSARLFLARVRETYPLSAALLFGSRARHEGQGDSDADIAVLMPGPAGRRAEPARVMAGIAFDVMLETGILIDPLPLWEEEWLHPERFNNPTLIQNIRRDGISL